MAASYSKTVLFGTVTHDKTHRQWPVAVFNTAKLAKSHVGLLRIAYASQDHDMITLLDPRHAKDVDGKPIPGVKYALAECQYNPVLATDGEADLGIGEI